MFQSVERLWPERSDGACANAAMRIGTVTVLTLLGLVVPFFFEFCPSKYVPHWKVKEVEGELAIALIYVGIQTSLIDALATLRKSHAYVKCGG